MRTTLAIATITQMGRSWMAVGWLVDCGLDLLEDRLGAWLEAVCGG